MSPALVALLIIVYAVVGATLEPAPAGFAAGFGAAVFVMLWLWDVFDR